MIQLDLVFSTDNYREGTYITFPLTYLLMWHMMTMNLEVSDLKWNFSKTINPTIILSYGMNELTRGKILSIPRIVIIVYPASATWVGISMHFRGINLLAYGANNTAVLSRQLGALLLMNLEFEFVSKCILSRKV